MYPRMSGPLNLSAIERMYLKAQREFAPSGHLIKGPYRSGDLWRCQGCSETWSNDTHPAIEEQESSELVYPYDA